MYALNTPEDVGRVAAEAGFGRVQVRLFESQPNYLTLHPALFAVGVGYERASNGLEALVQVRGSLLARLVARA